jgi:ABC-type glycerol-3-phosphate transport system substrate-binding protein
MDFLTVPFSEVPNNLLRARLDEFARANNEEVILQQIDWAGYWRELVNVSVHRRGADVAEIGSTWVEPLMAMNVLAPFTREDIKSIGGEGSFFPALWQNVTHDGGQNVWGIPSRIDMRMIFYWQDMFEAARVDPGQAFSSPDAMQTAFQTLRHSVPYPWGVPTSRYSPSLVHNIASWVWAAGGDFISPDGRKLLIDSHAARQGMRNYYRLVEFMPPECRDSSHEAVLDLFAARKIAATIGGPWLISYLRNAGLTPTMLNLVSVASPPGPPFVGGAVFIRWSHYRKLDLAWKLIKALSEKEFNLAFSTSTEWLPSHQDLWTEEFLSQNKYNREYLKGIRNGRGLPPVRLWGMIEDRLTQSLGSIWEDLFAVTPEARSEAVDAIIAKHLEPLAARLQTILTG